MKSVEVAKYFRRNPPLPLNTGDFRQAVVIPAYDELEQLPQTLQSLRRCQGVENSAVIVVVNHPAGGNEKASLELLEILREQPVYTLYLPDLSGGVGAARKAGMDAFLASQLPENMEKCVIFSLDADTLVEPDYLQKGAAAVLPGGAVTFSFVHRPADNAAQQRAIERYEAYLHRYVVKLREAGSPYAFFTIGSAFAVRGDVYLRVGGMKVRQAGEDFYFLQAVAKSFQVRECSEVVVHPSPRLSSRVPFGTGPAVADLLAGKKLPEIPDHAFMQLAAVLDKAAGEVLADPGKFVDGLPEKSGEFFRQEKFIEVWKRVLNNLPERPGARERAFNEWFDGLKTLRFLHFSG